MKGVHLPCFLQCLILLTVLINDAECSLWNHFYIEAVGKGLKRMLEEQFEVYKNGAIMLEEQFEVYKNGAIIREPCEIYGSFTAILNLGIL